MRHVILVPGLGLGGIELLMLKSRLRKAGLDARIYYYWPWRRSIDEYARRLATYVKNSLLRHPDFVAHSLGGLVVARMCASDPERVGCRVVTLGSPHVGCEAASRFKKVPGGAWLLGRGLRTALEQAPIGFPSAVKVGTIAGNLDAGLGWLLGIRRPNDSVVCVDEAHHPRATETMTLKVSHTAMLISKRVANEVDHFLKHKRFSGSKEGVAQQ